MEESVFHPNSDYEPPAVVSSLQKNRGRINVSPDEFQEAVMLTGRTSPADVFRELIRLVKEARDNPPMPIPNHYNGSDHREGPGYDPAKIRFDGQLLSERKYWQARNEKAKTLTAELHLAREIAKMDKKELELVIEAPKKLMELPERLYCYKCRGNDHFPSQCPNKVSTW